jgi:hypothetical protein
MPGDTPDYVLKNRTAWDGQADWYAKPGERNWASEEPVWGLWGIPEDDVGFFPDLEGREVLEDPSRSSTGSLNTCRSGMSRST